MGGYGREYPYAETFASPRDFRTADVVAAWQVRRGDLLGYTGDAGYSEAPHLHYLDHAAGGRCAAVSYDRGGLRGWRLGAALNAGSPGGCDIRRARGKVGRWS